MTLVVNGGEITYQDIGHSLRSGRPVIVVAGTGRTADAIAAARDGRGDDPRARRIAASGSTQVVQFSDPGAVFRAVESALAPGYPLLLGGNDGPGTFGARSFGNLASKGGGFNRPPGGLWLSGNLRRLPPFHQ